MSKPFVHLHNHSDYSLLDGACKIGQMVARAVEFGMPAIALTDHGNMFGAVEFYSKAKAAGIKPIIGMEAYITEGDRRVRAAAENSNIYCHLTLLAADLEGYRNLVRLASLGYLEGFYYKPRIDLELLQQHSRGLIALSGCARGLVADHLARGNPAKARQRAGELSEIFGPGNFFIELMDHGLEIERRVLKPLLEVARELNLPTVITNDTHYLLKEHAEAQDALVCIQTGKTVDDSRRLKFGTTELYLKSPEEMYLQFSELEDSLARTSEIAERCNLELKFGQDLLPAFPLPDGFDAGQYLEKLTREGASRRYQEITPEIEQRLQFELGTIRQTGFPGYFLIVADLVQHAKHENIPVGPGRGSAAGSLVSYCLEITNIDPLKYSLLFERFLNPERVNMPDIDIDFADRDRDQVIQYIRGRYGADSVTQIITFGTMAARSVVRDVGRVLGMAFEEVDRVAKMIPEELKMTLDKALELRPDLAELERSDPRIRKLLQISRVLEGANRHASTHAAGVVIAPGKLTDYLPLYRSSDEEVTTQYDKDWVEKIGLLKIDVLGLRTLTVIQDAVKMIKDRHGKDVVLDNLPLDDPDTFAIFQQGDTVGIFQFESPGMREYLRKLKPEVLDDIIAMNALYRPGPLGSGMVEDFIKRKQGEVEVSYPHPVLKPILESTYGVIVYQEQVMRIASDMAGFTLGGADQLRRAMGKKKAEVMEQMKEKFLAGAKEKGIDQGIAAKVYELMAYFAGYGFNKSHSAGYAVLAYQTAWLKAHYPREFMASLLTSMMGNTEHLVVFLDECRRMGIALLPPDVNRSEVGFSVEEEGIRFGLAAVKNVGKGAVEEIARARQSGGPFRCLGDFIDRVDSRVINKRLVESLIYAGSLRALEGAPEQQLTALEPTLDFCARLEAERKSGQLGLFGEAAGGMPQGDAAYPALNQQFEPWAPQARLDFEKEYLGFYISGHPLDRFQEELAAFTTGTSADFEQVAAAKGGRVLVGGLVTAVRPYFDKNNRQWAILTMEDRAGTLDVFVFAETYERHRELATVGQALLVGGRVNKRPTDEQGKLAADFLLALEEVRRDEGVGVELCLDCAKADEALLEQVQRALTSHGGTNPVYLRLKEPNGDCLLRSRGVAAHPSDELLRELRTLLGEASVRLAFHPRTRPADSASLPPSRMQTLLTSPPAGNGPGRGRYPGHRSANSGR